MEKKKQFPIEQVKKGDIFIVRPGENIPVDGIVLEGNSAVNEAALTGESIPVDKAPNDTVSAATVNQSGFLKCEASRVGEDTTLSQIIQMVSDAAATKAPIAKIADRVSGIFVPTVIYNRSDYDCCVAFSWSERRICSCQRNFRTCYQLPMCPWTCHSGRNYGWKWYGREKWNYVQDSRFSGRDRKNGNCCS